MNTSETSLLAKGLNSKQVFAKTLEEDFEKFILFVFGDYITGQIPKFHTDIYNLLINEKRLALAAPRGFAKSMICSVFYPTWLATFKKVKDICIIRASENLATDLLRKIKVCIESDEKFIDLFGDMRSSKWTESHIILSNGVSIRAKGAGGQIRGFRPEVLILDDIETDESVQSEDQRKKLKNWLFKACLNTLLPEGQFILVGTIIHYLSVLNDLLESPNKWTKRRLTAYVDGIEEEGHELWGESRPHKWLQERKAEIGSFAFASEFMNNPMADGSAPIKPEQIRYWTELPKQYSGVISVDPAYSEDEKADWKTASLVLIDQNNNRYLSHYTRTHAPQGEFIDAILNMYEQNRGIVTSIGIPNSGVEKSFYQSVLKRAEERKIYAPFQELKNTFITNTGAKATNKKMRIIAALQPLFEQGRYYINENHFEARDELLTIGASRHDDLVDTLAYAEQIITPYHVEPEDNLGRYGEKLESEKIFTGNNYGY